MLASTLPGSLWTVSLVRYLFLYWLVELDIIGSTWFALLLFVEEALSFILAWDYVLLIVGGGRLAALDWATLCRHNLDCLWLGKMPTLLMTLGGAALWYRTHARVFIIIVVALGLVGVARLVKHLFPLLLVVNLFNYLLGIGYNLLILLLLLQLWLESKLRVLTAWGAVGVFRGTDAAELLRRTLH